MAEKPPILFKCEPSLWEMMAQVNPDGRSARPFDFRLWDLNDLRIWRLGSGKLLRSSNPLHEGRPLWHPDEKEVSFLNKATGKLLTFEYLGVEFTPWAPGWGFLLLGKLLHPPMEPEP